MLRLSPKDREILLCGQLQAQESTRSIARQTGYREHTVRYCMEKFQRYEAIHPYPFVNIYPLGYEEFGLFFSVAAGPQIRQQLLEQLANAPQVAWILEVGGDFNFGLAICAQNSSEVVSFLHYLSDEFSDVIVGKALSVRVSWTLFPRQYLSQKKFQVAPLRCGDTGERISLDDQDKAILQALSQSPTASLREIAKQLSFPSSTVQQRVARLKKKNVLQGFAYEIDPPTIGAQGYRLLLFVRRLGPELSKRLYAFCERQPNVFAFIECLGSWDFELKVEVERLADLQNVTGELYETFKNDISEIKVLTIINTPKLSFYPFGQ